MAVYTEMSDHDLICLMAASIAATQLEDDSSENRVKIVANAAVAQAKAIVECVQKGAYQID